jgi:uncharacterized protein (DUF488 family)
VHVVPRPPLVIIWTIGHSTRTSGEFIALLERHAIEVVADVRRFPASRRSPRFSAARLERRLRADGIGYRWIPELGGRRRTNHESVNTGWRHAAFRGYADYVATPEFAAGLFELLMIGGGARTAVMCAEALWWRCHRRIIADVLTSLGVRVEHILGEGAPTRHRLSPPARVVRGALTYAGI